MTRIRLAVLLLLVTGGLTRAYAEGQVYSQQRISIDTDNGTIVIEPVKAGLNGEGRKVLPIDGDTKIIDKDSKDIKGKGAIEGRGYFGEFTITTVKKDGKEVVAEIKWSGA